MADRWQQLRGPLFLILVAIVLIALTLFVALWPRTAPPIMTGLTPAPSPTPTSTPRPLRVYVSGAVQRPDVYSLPPDSIVKDAILAAGGPEDDADLERINLASPLADGQQVYVPRLGDEGGRMPLLSQPTPSKVNLNTAGVAELDTLPGIGPTIAQRIIEYRQAHGPFTKVEDVLAVPGIGPVTFEKIRELITTQ